MFLKLMFDIQQMTKLWKKHGSFVKKGQGGKNYILKRLWIFRSCSKFKDILHYTRSCQLSRGFFLHIKALLLSEIMRKEK